MRLLSQQDSRDHNHSNSIVEGGVLQSNLVQSLMGHQSRSKAPKKCLPEDQTCLRRRGIASQATHDLHSLRRAQTLRLG